MKIQHLFLLFLIMTSWSCQKNSNDDEKSCGDSVIIDENLFNEASPDSFIVTDAFISGNCITVKVGASGCDPSNWQASLVTDGMETNSIPPSRLLKLNLTINEECTAYFTPEYTFYLGSENQTVIYSLQGWPNDLIYNE